MMIGCCPSLSKLTYCNNPVSHTQVIHTYKPPSVDPLHAARLASQHRDLSVSTSHLTAGFVGAGLQSAMYKPPTPGAPASLVSRRSGVVAMYTLATSERKTHKTKQNTHKAIQKYQEVEYIYVCVCKRSKTEGDAPIKKRQTIGIEPTSVMSGDSYSVYLTLTL